MPQIRFTDRKIQSLRRRARGQVSYFDQREPGFGIRVGGTKTWFVKYVHRGRQRWATAWGVQDPTAVLLPLEAIQQLNRLTAVELLQLAGRDILADHLRRRIALAGWTRAVVLGEHAVAREGTELLAVLVPEMASKLEIYHVAPQEESAFTAAFLLSKFPGLHPDLHYSLGRETPLVRINSIEGN